MIIRLLLTITICFPTINLLAQIKIGDNPSIIDTNSILELESANKVLVLTRMSTNTMNSIRPLAGALIYNTDTNCIHTFNGATWKSLCDKSSAQQVTTSRTAPSNVSTGDFWINTSRSNEVAIWNGSAWINLDSNPQKGSGTPSTLNLPNAVAGDVYVDETTGMIWGYNGASWLNNSNSSNQNNSVIVSNGISRSSDDSIRLGGALVQPTIIVTDASNTLSIQGLANTIPDENEILTINSVTGTLSKTASSNFIREEIIQITAEEGQSIFNNLTLKTTDKVNVYRNGVRIDFTILDTNTIEIEPDAICYQGDEIKIIQLY